VKPKDDDFVNDNDDDLDDDDDIDDIDNLNGQVDYDKFQPFFDNDGLDDDDIDIDDDDIDDDDSEQVDYEKFEAGSKIYQDEEEEEESLSPLPGYLNDNNDHDHVSQQSTSAADELQRRMQEQQRQIDMLISLIKQPQQQQQQQQPIPEMSQVTPLKAMLFIDGTWLYYSVHERDEQQCPIVRKYGRGWQTRYQLDWAALPRVISERLQLQETRQVEIARSSVYTSCKKDTSRRSNRIKMFEDMQSANYDVFMMETVGSGEKCVDIQLAVEMLHYATVPNAYDVAILLSGDKDFLPALIRTRQKGRKVGIVAFRAGCNRALYETPNVKDYDVVWMDDFLDRLVVPKESLKSQISIFTISKVIHDFIAKSGLPRVSSRDIGRYLKLKTLNQRSLLDELKQSYGGLYQFLTVSTCFDVETRNHQDDKAWKKIDPSDRTFW
jgi:uncharacterized LabA/DUF88 family protein